LLYIERDDFSLVAWIPQGELSDFV